MRYYRLKWRQRREKRTKKISKSRFLAKIQKIDKFSNKLTKKKERRFKLLK